MSKRMAGYVSRMIIGATAAVNFGLWQNSFIAGCFFMTLVAFVLVIRD